MKPPVNWRPPSHTAMRSSGVSIWSQLARSQVRRDADDAGDDQPGGEPVGLLAGHAVRSP